MKIPSDEIPQADILEDVCKSIEAVAIGRKSFQEIASFINKVDRQGRYYRKAAEILGFITNDKNYAELTELGHKYISSDSQSKLQVVRGAVLNTQIFQRIIPFIEKYPEGVSHQQLSVFLNEVSELGTESMANRRVSSIIVWLESTGIVSRLASNKLILKSDVINATPTLQFSTKEPLIPQTEKLSEYNTVAKRISNAHDLVMILRNQAAVDRANNTHIGLVNIVSDRIRSAGAIPRSNSLIDLATKINDQYYLFEMKSITAKNSHKQVRAGISQLYEYRYLQANPLANLVLVLSENFEKDRLWMREYIETDRNIYLVWDGSHQLFSSDRTRQDLSFLW